MIIKSDFKDYYDHIQAYAHQPVESLGTDIQSATSDRAPWIRKTIVEKAEPMHGFWPEWDLLTEGFVLGFCGHFYNAVFYTPVASNPKGLRYACFKEEHYSELVLRFEGKKRHLEYMDYEYWVNCDWSYVSQAEVDDFIDDTFDENQFDKKCNGHPIFLLTRGKIIFNPCLSDLEFQRIMDPHTAYMKLESWITTRARAEMEMPEISDQLKAETHGFNQQSFRTEKGGKKERRRANKARKNQK